MRLAQIALGDRLAEGHRCLRLGSNRGSHLRCIFGGLSHDFGHASNCRDIGHLGRSIAKLDFQSVHVGAHRREFLFAHEPNTADGTLDLRAHKADHEFAVGAALVDQILSDQLELFGELLGSADARGEAVVQNVLGHLTRLGKTCFGNARSHGQVTLDCVQHLCALLAVGARSSADPITTQASPNPCCDI